MRLFIAVDPSPEALAALAEAQGQLRAAIACRRWADLAGAHLTLQFLGEVGPDAAAAIAAAIAARAAETPPLALALAPLGAFPTPARPRVLWAGVAGDLPRLAALQAALGEGLRGHGITPEARAFRPHLTLAREPADPGAAGRALAAVVVSPVSWQAGEVVLYRSHLGPQGARYEAIGRHVLGG